MENNPRSRSNFEAPKAESDKPDSETKTSKKKSRSNEAESIVDKKPRASRELGHSIISAEQTADQPKSPLFAALEKAQSDAKNEIADESETSETQEDAEVTATVEQEKQHIASEIARSHLEQLGEGENEAADQKFLEQVADGEDVEAAFAQVATEYGMTEDEIAEALAEMPPDELLDADMEGSEVDAESIVDNPAELDDEDEIDLSAASAPPAPTSASSSGSGSGTGSGSGSGSGTPPPLPTPPVGGPVPSPTPATLLAARTPNVIPTGHIAEYDNNRAKAGQLLLVGIVGYLYGKHRGRLKTEKRLLPVQRKLQKQVVKLERDISHKERLLVAAKARAEQPQSLPKAEELPASRQETPVYAPTERTQPGRQETRIGMEKPVRAERLGHLVVAAEAPKAATGTNAERPNNIRQVKAEQVKAMSRNELLEVSEKIVVEGASLRKIYESNLVGEKQLRHLVSEYLQGKDIRKELRQEMVEHEIDFERDPIMRDRIRSHLAGGGKSGLSEMLASAGITTDDDNTELYRRARSEEAKAAKVKQRQEHRQRVVADTALATAVVVLAVAVLILALRS